MTASDVLTLANEVYGFEDTRPGPLYIGLAMAAVVEEVNKRREGGGSVFFCEFQSGGVWLTKMSVSVDLMIFSPFTKRANSFTWTSHLGHHISGDWFLR